MITNEHIYAIIKAATTQNEHAQQSLLRCEIIWRKYGCDLVRPENIEKTYPSMLTPSDPDSFDIDIPYKDEITISYSEDLLHINIDSKHYDFNHRAAIEKMIQISDLRPCPVCGGTGKYWSESMARDNEAPMQCQTCGGVGFVE